MTAYRHDGDGGFGRRLRVAGDRDSDGTVRIRVDGELDTFGVPFLRDRLAALLAAAPRCVELDLAEVSFCDIAGLRVFLDLRGRGQREGFEVLLTAVSPAVRLVLRLSGAASWPGAPED